MIDLHEVHEKHLAIHARLENWARWCKSGRGGTMVMPMFRLYRAGYADAPEPARPCDELDALAIQRAFAVLPERHRHALGWWYVFPFVAVGRIQRELGATRAALAVLVVDGRQMLLNLGVRHEPKIERARA